MRRLVRLSLYLGFSVCAFATVAPTDLWFNEVSYWRTLAQTRPGLLPTSNICYAALVLKPEFRDELLGSRKSPFDFQRENYSNDEKVADLAWIAAQQDALVAAGNARLQTLAQRGIDVHALSAADPTDAQFQRTVATFDWVPAAYPLNAFVGFRVGPAGVIADERGLDYKIFFEFSNFLTDFTPELFQNFAQVLSQAGFRGDFKTPSDPRLPGQLRFQYNNLIVHSHSIGDAKIAERVGRELFDGRLAHMSRGVDVLRNANGEFLAGLNSDMDWHHFLCTGKFAQLPADVQDFVTTSP